MFSSGARVIEMWALWEPEYVNRREVHLARSRFRGCVVDRGLRRRSCNISGYAHRVGDDSAPACNS